MTALFHLPEYLKQNHYDSLFFGLGFIQIKVNERERYHFYHPELMPIMPEEEGHNHRYDFRSYVLKGCLRQEIYSVYPNEVDPNWHVLSVSCDPDKPAPDDAKGCNPSIALLSDTYAGSDYEILKDTFHKVLPAREPTVTFLRRGPVVKEFAQVVRHKDAPEVCPFSPEMSKEEMWTWVEMICLE